MTSPRHPGRHIGVRAWLLAVLTAVGLLVFGIGTASAHTLPDTGNRVRASAPETVTAVGVSEHVRAGQGRGPPVLRGQLVVATGVAAEAAPEVINLPEVTAPNPVKPGNAVDRWDSFLGDGPTTNIHPRLGTPDPNRIVSADGLRSIRMGAHEMGSSSTKFHYHEETWSFDADANTWTVVNLKVNVPFPKGAW